MALSTKLVVVTVDGRACWRHLYDNRRVVAVYYKSVNSIPLTPFDLLWICRTCFYTVSQKKQDTKLLPKTSPNTNRFHTFFTSRLSGKCTTMSCLKSHHIFNMSIHYLVKYECEKTGDRILKIGWTFGKSYRQNGWLCHTPIRFRLLSSKMQNSPDKQNNLSYNIWGSYGKNSVSCFWLTV